MAALPLTTADTNADTTPTSRFAVLTNIAGRLKENAAQTFSDVRARLPPSSPPPTPSPILSAPQAKPLAEVFDVTAVSKPANLGELTGRVRNNVTYFRTNYAIVTGGVTALVMLMNPWSLIVLAILAGLWFWAYIIKTTPLVLGGRQFSDREKFLLLAGSSIFTIFFLTSVGATIFYALGLSMIMIGAHAALRVPDDATLFADEAAGEGGSLTGLLNMFKPRNALAQYAAVGV